MIGEGNFSFALALINKHDNKASHSSENSLAHSIIATELKKEIRCEECTLQQFQGMTIESLLSGLNNEPRPEIKCEKCSLTDARIISLHEKGALVVLGVDGTQIKETHQLQGKMFQRIHWNIPHDGGSVTNMTMPPVIMKFFASCSKVQNTGDRIHVTIPCPLSWQKLFYQGYLYDLVRAASTSGYQIIKKRKFELTRYPGYSHVRTNLNKSADVVSEGAREFVFQKMDPIQFREVCSKFRDSTVDLKTFATELTKLSPKTCVIVVKEFWKQSPDKAVTTCCFECSSDEDSSDYEI